jgi:ATP-dependent Lon protease
LDEKNTFDTLIKLGNNLNQRDVIAVKKTVSGLLKILYPDENFNKEDVEEVLKYALVGRRRVKEQLKKIGGMEFYDVHFSYIDNDTLKENFVSVPEIGGGKLIPEGAYKPGHVYTVGRGESGMLGVFKIEVESMAGSGKLEKSGAYSSKLKESINIAFNYFRANSKSISSVINTKTMDFYMHIQDLQGIGSIDDMALPAFIALCSQSLSKPIQEQMVVLGSMSIGGTIKKVSDLANVLQACFDAGAKKVLLPMSSAVDIPSVPPELFSKFQISFYQDPKDAVFKALGVS